MADDNKEVNQNEIEELLKQQGGDGPSGASPAAETPPTDEGSLQQDEIEALLNQGNDGGKAVAQDEIEAMMAEKGATPAGNTAAAAANPASSAARQDGDEIAQEDIELLLRQAETALESIQDPAGSGDVPGMESFRFEEFRGAPPSEEVATLDLIRDVEMDLRIELGRTHMHLEDILKLRKGSVVPLDKLAGDPVDVYVNGRLIARGEVLVLNDNFCVRVAELLSGETARAG